MIFVQLSLSRYIGLFSSELSDTKFVHHYVSLSHGLRSFVDVFKHMFFHLRSFGGYFDVYVLSFHSRTCIPAEAEPLLNSSGCYSLVNFTHTLKIMDSLCPISYKERLLTKIGPTMGRINCTTKLSGLACQK